MKFTKTELRTQQVKLAQLQRYLPTLQLKKAMLQMEVLYAQQEIEELKTQFKDREDKVEAYSPLLADRGAGELFPAVKIEQIQKSHENIAGVDIPCFEKVIFAQATYSLLDTPIWLEAAIEGIKELLIAREKVAIAREKKRALEKELREVSIRVNLFEKILIPRAKENIRKIKIFLGDLQLAAVSQAKISKRKITLRKAEFEEEKAV